MKIWVELHDGKTRTYDNVDSVQESKDSVKVYRGDDILAIISKSDLKNLLRGEDGSDDGYLVDT